MDLTHGFQIDEPAVMVQWSVREQNLGSLVGPGIRQVTDHYWTARVRVLGELSCNLGFHFRGHRGQLSELEFFRDSYAKAAESFEDFQKQFETAFGAPTERSAGTQGFPSYRWVVPGAEIVHLVFDRFGPEEHMRIRRRGAA